MSDSGATVTVPEPHARNDVVHIGVLAQYVLQLMAADPDLTLEEAAKRAVQVHYPEDPEEDDPGEAWGLWVGRLKELEHGYELLQRAVLEHTIKQLVATIRDSKVTPNSL
jgi:hypothetical protein